VDGTHPSRDAAGKLNPRLAGMFKSYSKADPPPEQVKPIPVQLLEHAIARLSSTDFRKALADLIVIGFFFLLRPGEHTFCSADNTPFTLQDVSFVTPSGTFNAATIDLDLLSAATKVHLNFTNQKNGVKNEAITHGFNSHPFLCPLKAVRRRVRHLRAHQALPTTPLHTVFASDNTSTQHITDADITAALRASCVSIGDSIGIQPSDISARALRAGGAMALLRAGVADSSIRLLGRWKSWAMLEYLHKSASDTTGYASRMLACGSYTLNIHKSTADAVTDLLPAPILMTTSPLPGLCLA